MRLLGNYKYKHELIIYIKYNTDGKKNDMIKREDT